MIFRAQDATVVLDNNDAIGKQIGRDQDCEFVRLELTPGGDIPAHALDRGDILYAFGRRHCFSSS